tara:strand:+ start:264 stop:545 length:282 start_codon:yes stop_codon:yes gene_type:complete
MDRTTLTNFNNIRSEIMRVRVKTLINTLHANQGLYDVESIGSEMGWLQIEVMEASQRQLKKLKRTSLESSPSDESHSGGKPPITPQETDGKDD